MLRAIPTDQLRMPLRLRRCCYSGCTVIFTLCIACDRGQRYCTDVCRKRARQEQLRTAGRRYQTTEAGKAKHCSRQRAYRQRRSVSAALVTHQGPVPIANSTALQASNLSSCAICRRQSPWIQPFDWLARPKRRVVRCRRAALDQKTAFLGAR